MGEGNAFEVTGGGGRRREEVEAGMVRVRKREVKASRDCWILLREPRNCSFYSAEKVDRDIHICELVH